MLIGKEKLKTYKIWSEEKLERILYEIQNINYKMTDFYSSTGTTKKKRVITEASEQNNNKFNSSLKNPFGGIVNSTSNSKFPSGRKN